MIKRNFLLLSTLFILFPVHVAAEYKTSGEMTNEEYQMISDAQAGYNECLNDHAISQIQVQNDVRVIADHSMKKCGPVLEGLYEKLTAENYSPEFSSRFVSGISNRAANTLLQQLMMMMAAKNSQSAN